MQEGVNSRPTQRTTKSPPHSNSAALPLVDRGPWLVQGLVRFVCWSLLFVFFGGWDG